MNHLKIINASRGLIHLKIPGLIFRWGNLRKGDHLEDPGVDGRIFILIFRKLDAKAWTVLIWLRIRKGGGNL
jgi:hypothetical protein